MAAKRNKTEDEQVKAQANADAQTPETPETTGDAQSPEIPEEPKAPETPKAEKPAPINADKMAAAVKVNGNSYQQYARQMFKDRLEASR